MPFENRVVLRGNTEGQTDVTKLIIAFGNITNKPRRVEVAMSDKTFQ